MLSVQQAADSPQRAHAHSRDGTGGAAQELHAGHHILCAVQAEGKLGDICPQGTSGLLFFQQGFECGCLFEIVGRGDDGGQPGQQISCSSTG